MSISKEEFDMLQSGDRILIKEEIEGIKKGQKSGLYWAQFIGEWLTVREIKHDKFVYGSALCLESRDEKLGFDVYWNLNDIADVDNGRQPFFDREDDISLLFC